MGLAQTCSDDKSLDHLDATMTDQPSDSIGEPGDHTSDGEGVSAREHGVEFGDLAAELEDLDYPTTAEELVDAYGDYELGVPDGSESVREALGPYVESDREQRYDSPREVQQAVLNMVGSDAVGREGYSDRGDVVDQDDQESV